MTVTVTSFRSDFPEFGDTTKYPDSLITYWLTAAGLMLDPVRWDTWLDLGTENFIAHNIVMEAQAAAAAANGATPGTSQGGVVSSKSVDKVSVSYDVGSAAEKDAGHWNMTIYGRRYIKMARQIGMGPIAVGPNPNITPDPLTSGSGWPGPIGI